MQRERLDPHHRKIIILDAAVEVFKEHGFRGLTHNRVAVVARCGKSTIYRVAGDRKRLRMLLIAYARRRGYAGILDAARHLKR